MMAPRMKLKSFAAWVIRDQSDLETITQLPSHSSSVDR